MDYTNYAKKPAYAIRENDTIEEITLPKFENSKSKAK